MSPGEETEGPPAPRWARGGSGPRPLRLRVPARPALSGVRLAWGREAGGGGTELCVHPTPSLRERSLRLAGSDSTGGPCTGGPSTRPPTVLPVPWPLSSLRAQARGHGHQAGGPTSPPRALPRAVRRAVPCSCHSIRAQGTRAPARTLDGCFMCHPDRAAGLPETRQALVQGCP